MDFDITRTQVTITSSDDAPSILHWLSSEIERWIFKTHDLEVTACFSLPTSNLPMDILDSKGRGGL